MTNEPTKYCTKCKRSHAISSFSKDGRSKDGLQKWCKIAMQDHKELRKTAKRKKAKVLKEVINETPKIQKLVEVSNELGGDLVGAYQSINGNVSRARAREGLNCYLERIADNTSLSKTAEKITESSLFKSFVDKYLNLCYESSNPSYMKDAILTMGKLSGQLITKTEVNDVSAEDANARFESKMAKVLDKIHGKETVQ